MADQADRLASELFASAKLLLESQQDAVFVQLVLSHPQLATVTDEWDTTLLEYAMWNGRRSAVEALVRAGADVNRRNDEGHTPLTGSLDSAKEDAQVGDMIRLLCTLGANPNGLDRLAESPPLYYAVSWKLPECIRALLDSGADINKQEWEYGDTPLHGAGLNEAMVRLLLDRGADPWIENWKGHNTLHVLSMDFDLSNHADAEDHTDQELLAIKSRILDLVRAVPKRTKI